MLQQHAEREIRELIEHCRDAARRGDHAAIGRLYGARARFMPSHAPLAVGPEAASEIWRKMLALPDLTLSWTPATIEASEDGGLAYVTGSYVLEFGIGSDRRQDRGKYVAVWQKIDGAWKIVADIANSDLP